MSNKSKTKNHIGIITFFKWFLFDKEESWKTKILHWVALILFIAEAFALIMGLFDTTLDKNQNYTVYILWENYFQKFTYQSNIILFFVIILFIGNFGRKDGWMYWRTNLCIICAVTYITITGVTYASFLYKYDRLFGMHYIGNTNRIEYLWYIRTILEHYVCPLLMLFFFIWSCFCPRYYGPQLKGVSYTRALIIGFIYPVLYFSYTIFAAYVLGEPVYPYITDFKNYPFYSGMFFLAAFVVFGAFLFLFTFLSNRFITNPNKRKYDSKSLSRS